MSRAIRTRKKDKKRERDKERASKAKEGGPGDRRGQSTFKPDGTATRGSSKPK